MFVILNPSPFVTLSPFASLRINSAKDLAFWLRVNSVKNRMISVESIIEILPCLPAGRG
jgi:hypothetical protein